LLRRNDLPYFHMTDFVARSGFYKGWPEEKRLAVMKRIVTLESNAIRLGVAATLLPDDYERLSERDRKLIPDPYGLCLTACIAETARLLQRQGVTDSVAYVFESGDPGQGATKHQILLSGRTESDCRIVSSSAFAVLRWMLPSRVAHLSSRNPERARDLGSPLAARTLGSRVQDVDRPAQIQALPEPARARRPRVEAKALRGVTRAERLDGISGHRGGRRHLGQRAAVRPPESERAVGPARDLETLLVHRSVVPAAEEREVRERRRPSLGPVAEMMPLAIAHAAAREPAAAVPMVERPPQGGGNRPGPGPDLDHAALLIMAHHHPAGIARQAPGRLRGSDHVAIATPRGPETQ